MRVLLDNCVDRRFAKLLTNHEVIHAREMGWAELSNGILIKEAESNEFDVMITVDKNLQYQQSLVGRKLSIITLNSLFVDFRAIEPLAPSVLQILQSIESGSFVKIDS
ncbi:MAG: hypothetical protein JST12_07805 [Armatimonadetes bacterium]|nr:hypothetical protein [Armatimonadota bacterium]